MKFVIEGDYPVLRCTLNKGETITTSAGSMSWMSDGFKLSTTTGGLMKGLARAFSGESMFMNYYTSQQDNQEIVFASSLPGSIVPVSMQGQTILAQKTA